MLKVSVGQVECPLQYAVGRGVAQYFNCSTLITLVIVRPSNASPTDLVVSDVQYLRDFALHLPEGASVPLSKDGDRGRLGRSASREII